MAMRCFGRAGLTAAARPLLLIFFRAVDLAAIFCADDFFCTALLPAAREADVFLDFLLAIGALPFRFLVGKTSTVRTVVGGLRRCLRRAHHAARSLGRVGTRSLSSGAHSRDPVAFAHPTDLQTAHRPTIHRKRNDQCSRNTPSTARSSAGLISLECATVTE